MAEVYLERSEINVDIIIQFLTNTRLVIVGNIFFRRGPPTTTSCTRSSERCAGSSSAWHSSFQLVSGFFKKVKTSFSPVFVGKAMCPASSFLRSAYFPLFIHLSSSSGLITAAPPLCRRAGGDEFFSGGFDTKQAGRKPESCPQTSVVFIERAAWHLLPLLCFACRLFP